MSWVRVRRQSKPRPDDRFHAVLEGDRAGLLTQRYLGQTGLR
jgi:hypothetical protein